MIVSRLPRGNITKYGYRRITVRGIRKQRMEHVLVWEAAHGPVPPGHELHHINEDKLDNRLENLQLVTRLEHKRIHSGCVMKEGVWWKRCRKCDALKPITAFYVYPGRNGVMGPCKVCCSRLAVMYKQKRNAAKRALLVRGDSVAERKAPTQVEAEKAEAA